MPISTTRSYPWSRIVGGERAQPRQLRLHRIEGPQPAQSVRDLTPRVGIVGPDVETLPPQRVGGADGVEVLTGEVEGAREGTRIDRERGHAGDCIP